MKTLYQGDCLEFLREDTRNFNCIIADPPDNIGLHYDYYDDDRHDYFDWLEHLLYATLPRADVLWLSYYHKHDIEVKYRLRCVMKRFPRHVRMFIWYFNFGQYQETDNPNCYRPILRISKHGWNPIMEERVPSVREKMGDLRATGKGIVPSDVWEYCRIQGNNSERRPWHVTQHPEDLYRRIIRQSVPLVDGVRCGSVVDLFCGSGTLFRAGWEPIEMFGVELSPKYCEEIAREHGIPIRNVNDDNRNETTG